MTKAAGEGRSRVTLYVAGLASLAVGSLVFATVFDAAPGAPVGYWLYLTILYSLTEYVMTLFHHQSASGRVGLSAAEAIILPLIVASSTSQFIWAIVIGATVVSVAHRRAGFLKGVFNVAQFACAAALSSVVWRLLEDPSTAFSPRDALAAVVSVLVFAASTHVSVAIAIALAEGRSIRSLSRDVAPATFVSLTGNVCVGLLLAAAYAGRSWTAVFFILPVGALILGYRAVIRQDLERIRVERMHDATRALAENLEVEPAALSFLGATAEALSSQRAWAVIQDEDDRARVFGVLGDEVIAADELLLPDAPLADLLETFERSKGPLMVGWDQTEQREIAARLDVPNLLAVPIAERHAVTGCLVVGKRVGAGSFTSEDARLLETLANEFSVTLRARYDKARSEAEKGQLETQLHRAQRLESVGQLAGGIAHDFNNIVSIIVNYAHFVMSEVEDESVKEDIREIKKAADRASGLTRQLLIFSRKEIAKPVILDVNDVVSDLEKLLRRAVGESVALQIHLGSGLRSVLADSAQLEQVVLNLAINARDAMPDGGTLRIETSNVTLSEEDAKEHLNLGPGDHVRLRVTDTGTGMDEATQERIFEPFFTTKPKGVGTGLGLATAYGIVGQAGGQISVTSKVGLGSTFTVHLPASTEYVPLETTEAESRQTQVGNGETIMVVEDEEALRSVARRILTSNGYRVIEARDGREALRELENGGRVDLVLSDIVMPNMSGVELGRRLGELVPEVGLIYMSGHSNHMVERAPDDEIPLIQKPFEQEELLDTVKKVLST